MVSNTKQMAYALSIYALHYYYYFFKIKNIQRISKKASHINHMSYYSLVGVKNPVLFGFRNITTSAQF